MGIYMKSKLVFSIAIITLLSGFNVMAMGRGRAQASTLWKLSCLCHYETHDFGNYAQSDERAFIVTENPEELVTGKNAARKAYVLQTAQTHCDEFDDGSNGTLTDIQWAQIAMPSVASSKQIDDQSIDSQSGAKSDSKLVQ